MPGTPRFEPVPRNSLTVFGRWKLIQVACWRPTQRGFTCFGRKSESASIFPRNHPTWLPRTCCCARPFIPTVSLSGASAAWPLCGMRTGNGMTKERWTTLTWKCPRWWSQPMGACGLARSVQECIASCSKVPLPISEERPVSSTMVFLRDCLRVMGRSTSIGLARLHCSPQAGVYTTSMPLPSDSEPEPMFGQRFANGSTRIHALLRWRPPGVAEGFGRI